MAENQEALAEFYDKGVGVWDNLSREHMHFGYYAPGATATIGGHRASLVRLIDEALCFAEFPDDPEKKPRNMLDVGCGIGGTCLHVAKKYDIQCKGINISPEQVKIAQGLAAAQGLESKVSFDVGDALDMPYPDGAFDLVLSIHCIEHLQDKEKFIREMVRVAASGATIIILSHVHRDLSPSEQSLKPQEERVLRKIGSSVQAWFCPLSNYVSLLAPLPVEVIKIADWSRNIDPSSRLMLKVAFSVKGIVSNLMKGVQGWTAIKNVLPMKLLHKALHDGLVKFVVLTCRKSN
uniref:Ajmaline N-methyltransferase n=1 Tax=Rauvolfia serpentina TaxID=4060 RepID=ANMT_RAUSE|nr:tocopherol-like methyltransferase [Rauvolfia serpentina]